ncbi:hypothetical protein OROGR_008525 [Orobanche gracilis]
MKEAYPVTDLNYVTDDIDQRNITTHWTTVSIRTMVSAADRKKLYHDIPDEKKQMLAARRQTYSLNKRRSIVQGL